METESHDINSEADVRALVETFYDKVRQDKLLAPIFEPVIGDNWDHHLGRMTDFWSTLLLYTRKFSDDPLTRHLPLALTKEHFDRWLLLFRGTIDELFQGQVAENARKRACNIARIMKAVKHIDQ